MNSMPLFLSRFNKVQLLILALMVVGVVIQLVLIVNDQPLVSAFLAMAIALGAMAIAFMGNKKPEGED